jgi:hypothetical protein
MPDHLEKVTVIVTIIWLLRRLSVSKQAAQNFYMEIFTHKNLIDMKVQRTVGLASIGGKHIKVYMC